MGLQSEKKSQHEKIPNNDFLTYDNLIDFRSEYCVKALRNDIYIPSFNY